MNEPQNSQNFWESQNSRFGSFLIASSFLVAAFVQMMTADKEVNSLLVHAVAAIGLLIALLYTFMNFWLAMPSWLSKYIKNASTVNAQVIHTWFIPFLFVVFWLVVWINATSFWWAILLSFVFLLLCFVFQILRKPAN